MHIHKNLYMQVFWHIQITLFYRLTSNQWNWCENIFILVYLFYPCRGYYPH